MADSMWSAVDEYVTGSLLDEDEGLAHAQKASAAAGLPAIAVSPAQGKFLYLLARMLKAKRILEIGTLGGYSTIWFARALGSEGKITTLEFNEKHAAVARKNFEKAGVAHLVDLRLGDALETLPKVKAEGAVPFDLVFVDADKKSNAEYFEWGLELTHPGSLIIVDNVVRGGGVLDAASKDPDVRGVRRLYERMHREKRVSATALQTVGVKGWDGLAFALVL